MPIIEVEISITRKVETCESGTVEIDVPKSVIESDELEEWVSNKYDTDSHFASKVDGALMEDDSDEDIDWEFVEKVED